MNADAEAEGLIWFDTNVQVGQGLLYLNGTLDGIDRTRELGQDAVACGIRDPPSMLLNQPVHDLAVGRERAQGLDLILAHEPGV
jgi:hypothetical protein